MSEREASALRNAIKDEYPKLAIFTYRIGNNEYVCIVTIGGKPFYLWNVQDWFIYKNTRKELLKSYNRIYSQVS